MDRKRRRLGVAAFKAHDGRAGLTGLVGEVRLDAGSGKDHDADRKDIGRLIVAPELCGLAMLRPVGLTGDLRPLTEIGPACGDELGSAGRLAGSQTTSCTRLCMTTEAAEAKTAVCGFPQACWTPASSLALRCEERGFSRSHDSCP